MYAGLDVGDMAPDFELKTATGEEVRLSDYRGKVNVLLTFYVSESDPYSTEWLQNLRDNYVMIRSENTEVLAISSDISEKACDIEERYRLPFKILCDPEYNVIRAYGVLNDLRNKASASIFIIDRSGMIRYKYVGRTPVDLPPVDDLIQFMRYLL